MPRRLGDIAKWVKNKIPGLRKGQREKPRSSGDEVSVKPLLAYFVVNHMDEQGWSITRDNLQNAFREATRSLQTSGFVQKGSHQPTELGKQAMEVMRDRGDYWEAQDKYGDMLDRVRVGGPRRYRESKTYRGGVVCEDGKLSESAILSISPPDGLAEKISLASNGGVPTSDVHITLFHFNCPEEHIKDEISNASAIAFEGVSPFKVRISGCGTFVNDDDTVEVLLVDGVEMYKVRDNIKVVLDDLNIEYSNNYGWSPHITTGYNVESQSAQNYDHLMGLEWKCSEIHMISDNINLMSLHLKGNDV